MVHMQEEALKILKNLAQFDCHSVDYMQEEALKILKNLAQFECYSMNCYTCPCWDDKRHVCISDLAQAMVETWEKRLWQKTP